MKVSRTTKVLLACGVALSPVFYLIVVAQLMTRAGFDIRLHPLSLLTLGHSGWIQVANFIATGLLAVCCALGLRLANRHVSMPAGIHWLIGTFGLGLIIAGVSKPDPLLGFPPGTPMTVPTQMSVHASFHGAGFGIGFVSLVVADLVSAVWFLRHARTGWSLYCAGTCAVSIALLGLGFADPHATGVAFFLVGIPAFGWVSALAADALNRNHHSHRPANS